jgi:hypothetical protein
MYNIINLKEIKSIITLLAILLMAYIILNSNISYVMPIRFNSADSVMTNFYP